MRVVVGEGSQPVEFFLPGGVPERELDVDVVDEDIMDVVFENGGFASHTLDASPTLVGDVFFLLDGREVASCEDVKEGCLAACSVASASEYILACSCSYLHYGCDLEHTITPTSSAPSSPLHTTASCQLFNHNHKLTSVPSNEALAGRLSSVKSADRKFADARNSTMYV